MSPKSLQDRWPVRLIRLTRALTAGLAYYSVVDIPGLTSALVAIFVSLLLFDVMVAIERVRGGWKVWKDVFAVIIPRVSGTALTLIQGLFIGAVFALLVQGGLPLFLGAALTVGMAYTWAEKTSGITSTYVGIIGGLAIFDKICQLEVTGEFLSEAGPVVISTVYGTFAALIWGWFIGINMGIVTRLFLPRGYHSVLSFTCDLPLRLQPVRDVSPVEKDLTLIRLVVEPGAAVAGHTLRSLDLRGQYGAVIMRIDRDGKIIRVPTGDDRLGVGDTVLVLLPRARMPEVIAKFKERSMLSGDLPVPEVEK